MPQPQQKHLEELGWSSPPPRIQYDPSGPRKITRGVLHDDDEDVLHPNPVDQGKACVIVEADNALVEVDEGVVDPCGVLGKTQTLRWKWQREEEEPSWVPREAPIERDVDDNSSRVSA